MGSRVRTTDSTRVNDVSTTGIECQLSILNVRWKIVRRFEATFSSLSPPSPRLWLIRGKVRSLPARVEFFSSRFDEMRFYFRRDGWKGFSRIEFRAFSNRSLSNSYIYNPLWIISTRLFSGCGKPWLMEQCGANYRPSLIIERSSRSNCYFNPPSPPRNWTASTKLSTVALNSELDLYLLIGRKWKTERIVARSRVSSGSLSSIPGRGFVLSDIVRRKRRKINSRDRDKTETKRVDGNTVVFRL